MSKNVDIIVTKLKEEYPESKTSLDFQNPYQLLVATMLSAQTTDKSVNLVTPILFDKYPTPSDLAKANLEELIEVIKAIGLYNNKSKNLIAMANSLVDFHEGMVPNTIKELTKLAGVGTKTATAVLANAFGIKDQGITVDTHMMRITRKLGWHSIEKNNATQIEKELMRVVPVTYWGDITHLIIDHGRAICSAKKPQCDNCVINEYCPGRI